MDTTETIKALEKRIRDLEDKDALRRLMVRGWRALDFNDLDAWEECWAEDATVEFAPWGRLNGRAAFRRKVEETEGGYDHKMHHILNTDFAVDGDTASGVGFMWFVGIADKEKPDEQINLGGPYEWDYRRENGCWRIQAMRLGLWYKHGEDTHQAFLSDDA